MAAVSVVVITHNPGSALADFVRSVDAQSLPAADFELLVVDSSDDGSTARLQQLAGRRPNVVVLVADAGASTSDRIALALERATGDYVLAVGQEQKLAPLALELLLDKARTSGADVVVGRVATDDASGSAVLPDDADAFAASDVDLAGSLAMVRRSLTADRAGAPLLDAPSLTAAAGTVAAVGRYACAVQTGGAATSTDGASVDSSSTAWVDGTLQVVVDGRLAEPLPAELHGWLVVAQGPAEIAVPAEVDRDEWDRTTFTASAVLDPSTAAGGHPLDDGPWTVAIRVGWPGHEVTLPLTSSPARSAVVVARPYVVRVVNHVVQLDAGATAASVIGRVSTARTSIAETAHGILVTLDYPELHVHGEAVLDARMLLDGFGLPGHLVCREGGARLEVYASSLAGTADVTVVAGGGKPAKTGLRLRVDGTGAMAFETVPAPKPKVPAASAPVDVPRAQALRRRLPGALDPVLHRLAHVPVLRRAYRRLINL